MKKKTILNAALLLIPLMVVGIAVSPNSVTVVSDGETLYTTFATAVEGSVVGWCAPVVLLLTYALFALAVVYGMSKKPLWLKAIQNVALAATCLAAVPPLVQGDVFVVPNVFAAILLAALWAVVYFERKNGSAGEPQKKGRQLSRN